MKSFFQSLKKQKNSYQDHYKIKNPLTQMADDICRQVKIIDPKKEKYIAWYGRSTYTGIVNLALTERGHPLHYVVDRRPKIWGYSVEAANNYTLVTLPVKQIIKPMHKEIIVILPSKSPRKLNYLIKLGVSEENILIVPDRAEYLEKIFNDCKQEVSHLQEMTHQEKQCNMFETLKVFRDFCDAHHLRYFLAGGTLLGAIRHKGFIPWDDDVDVYLPDKDYEKFLKKFNDESNRYSVLSHENSLFRVDGATLVDNDTVCLRCKANLVQQFSVGISILRLTGYPDNEEEITTKTRANKMLEKVAYSYRTRKTLLMEQPSIDMTKEIEKFKYNHTFGKYPLVGKAHILNWKELWFVPYSVFESEVLVEFEGEMFYAPIDYDFYLKHRFSDYMQLPPKEEQVGMHEALCFFKHKRKE